MRTAMWLALVAFVGGYLIYAAATLDRRGDEAQIRSLVGDTAAAVEKRDLDGAIRCVSADYKDDEGLTHDKLRMLVAQTLRTDSSFTVDAAISKLTVQGSAATITVRALVKSSSGGVIYDRDLILSLSKERGRHAWVWPEDVWRVTNVNGLHLETDLGGF
jgi:hypothetical protein